jgi:hypothetical protein
MTDEFRSLQNGRPVCLNLAELAALEQMLQKALPGGQLDISYRVGAGSRTVNATSIDELLTRDLPDASDSMTVRALRWNDEREIDAGVSITFNHNNISWQPHALDEGVFLKIEKNVKEFLEARKPWHWRLNKSLPFIGGVIIGWAMLSSAAAVKENKTLMALVFGLLALVLIAVSGLSIQQKIFPYVRLNFKEKPARNYLQIASLMVGAATLAVALVSLFVNGE